MLVGSRSAFATSVVALDVVDTSSAAPAAVAVRQLVSLAPLIRARVMPVPRALAVLVVMMADDVAIIRTT